jgi:hypothetical protein
MNLEGNFPRSAMGHDAERIQAAYTVVEAYTLLGEIFGYLSHLE